LHNRVLDDLLISPDCLNNRHCEHCKS
jgi:hypothetical protein